MSPNLNKIVVIDKDEIKGGNIMLSINIKHGQSQCLNLNLSLFKYDVGYGTEEENLGSNVSTMFELLAKCAQSYSLKFFNTQTTKSTGLDK